MADYVKFKNKIKFKIFKKKKKEDIYSESLEEKLFMNMGMYLFIEKIHIYKIVITMHTIFTCSGILERENSQQSMLHK